MTTFVLVHGGGHGGWCWAPVRRALQHAGHEVFAPTLSGLADRSHLLSPELGLETHVANIAALLRFEDLHDVVLVGHSYGGMVVTGAADREAHRVGRLVYLDAAIPEGGEALVDVSPGLLLLAGTTRIVDGVELGLWPDAAAQAIYGLETCPLKDWALERLTPHPWKTVTDKLILRDPVRLARIPRTVVNCPASLTNRPEAMRHRWLQAELVLSLDTGHDMMLTAPQKVIDILLQAGKFG
ncbi:alpha/beta fold hydrolase [Novosphingobium sp. ZW T3_23]|uniref:alpha/beta fold hydrolase n=1 Tax=Novosphingobium sp. ZW T3_23 TaxID=3378084 RepID=UPI0038518E83